MRLSLSVCACLCLSLSVQVQWFDSRMQQDIVFLRRPLVHIKNL